MTNIDTHGIWVYVRGAEHFLPYGEYPWFRDAKVSEIVNVELLHGVHLYWPSLDVGLAVDSLANPEKYPLTAR